METQSYEHIFAETKEILSAFNKNNLTIEENTQLVNDLGLDSLLVMEVVTEVEDRFDLSFPLNNLSDIQTVKDLTRQIQHLLEAQ